MRVYLYRAALYCEDCGKKLCASIPKPEGMDPDNESTWDSDDYPKGPYPNGGGEADTPQHCDSCHVFLENPLTPDGGIYVREAADAFGGGADDESWEETATRLEALGSTPQGNGPTVAEWIRFYLTP